MTRHLRMVLAAVFVLGTASIASAWTDEGYQHGEKKARGQFGYWGRQQRPSNHVWRSSTGPYGARGWRR